MALTIQDWGAIGELASAILLFLSLTYVGFQIQQTRKMMSVTAAQARSDGLINILATLEDVSFSECFCSVREKDYEMLSVDERSRVSAFFMRLLLHSQNGLYQRKQGVLDTEQSLVLDSMPYFTQGVGYSYWQRTRLTGGYTKSFVDHIDKVIKQARGEQGLG